MQPNDLSLSVPTKLWEDNLTQPNMVNGEEKGLESFCWSFVIVAVFVVVVLYTTVMSCVVRIG